MKHCVFLLVLVSVLSNCKTEPVPPPPEPIIVVQDPLVLQEISPLPRAVVVARNEVQEFEPVYVTFRIIEVSEVNGVQKYFIVRVGQDKTGVSVGVKGEIAEDSGFERIIGSYRILELYGDFFRCEIEELTHRIGGTAFVRVQTGEKLKGESSS
jgi:hypothetical protein